MFPRAPSLFSFAVFGRAEVERFAPAGVRNRAEIGGNLCGPAVGGQLN